MWRSSLAALMLVVLLAAVGAVFFPGAREALHAFDERRLGGVLWSDLLGERLQDDPTVFGAASYDWVPPARFFPIAHALGESSDASANSMAAFARSHAAGFRLFEVDLTVTTDGRLVCLHGADSGETLSFSDFEQRNAGRRDRACMFADLVAAARAHPDIHFILDVKNRFDDAYRIMRRQIAEPALGKSFIPQLYAFSQAPQFSDGFFAGPIFTGYRSYLGTRQIIAAARQTGIGVVTVSDARLARLAPGDPVLREITILAHPVDDAAQARRWRDWEIRGIYTFTLSPQRAPDLYQAGRP